MKSYIRNLLFFLLILAGAVCWALFENANKFNDVELAREYAPEFWFAQEEKYYPCDYSLFFFDKDNNEIPGELAKQKYDSLSFQDKLRNFKVFYNVDKSDPNQTIIQYWTIYVFNDFSNQHYGDIEGTTVFVDNKTGKINKIVGNAHFGTYSKIIAANNQADNLKQSHTIVLVEKGSHASCPDPNGDGQIGPRELANWYNAYGILNWTANDNIYGVKMAYDDPNYKLAPLAELEAKMQDREALQKSPQLGWSITTRGNFLGLGFTQTITSTLGGDPLNLNNIDQIKDNPNQVLPITWEMIGQAIQEWFEMIRNNLEGFFGLKQSQPETAQLIKELAEEKIVVTTTATTVPAVAGIETKVPDQTPIVVSAPKPKSQKEIDKELKEIQKELNRIKKEVEKLEKKAEKEKQAQEKEEAKQQKQEQETAKKSLPTLLISKIASGIDNAKTEFLEIYNPNDQAVEINDSNLELIFVSSSGQKTNKNIKFKNNTIPAKGFFLLSSKDQDYDASFASGITQTGGIILQDKNDKVLDKVAWGKNPPLEAAEGEPYHSEKGLRTNSCLFRKSQGFVLQDSQNNQADFSLAYDFWFQDSLGQKVFYKFPPYIEESGGGTVVATVPNRAITSLVIINEIMYNASGTDSGHEWIELYNTGTVTTTIDSWKINESSSSHKFTLASGTAELIPGGFAILANDPDKFLLDWPQYSGPLFKSLFALNNTSELIILLDQDQEIDRAYYASSTGANGNGNSLQLINNVWVQSWPTPGAMNVLTTTTATTTEEVTTTPSTTPEIIPTSTPEIIPTSTPEIIETSTATTTQTTTVFANTIIINELAWAGTNTSTADEWIELYNYGTTTVNLLGWTITKNATSFIDLIDFNLEPDSYFLLERTNDQTVLDIDANQIYTGALNNDGEILELKDPLQETIDYLDCSQGWFAGSNTSTARISMERISATTTANQADNWKNYNITTRRVAHDAGGQYILGTPKHENSPIQNPTASEPDDPDILNEFLNETEPTSTPTTTPEITTTTPEIIPTSTPEILETSTATTTI